MVEDVQKIKSRSFLSAFTLVAQTSYAAFLGFGAFFILTLKSGIHLLGIYNTVLAMLSFFNYFTNLGLAAALLQKKDLEKKDIHTAFFIQFFLTIIAIIIGFLLTNHLFTFYKDLPHTAIYLYWAVLVSFLLLSLKTIPSVLLEKKIAIYKVVFVQALENTVFYACVIIFSLLGFEIYGLVIAVLFRSLTGVIAIYIMYPWSPRLIFSLHSAKRLLRYGIPFQGNSFLALIKDDLLVIYLGSAIGLTNLGYVTFGKKYAEFSIRIVMDSINRVAFPLFARFQKEKELLAKSLEKVLFYESLFIFPILMGAVFIFDSLLKIIPGYYEKWNIALFSFYFFSVSSFFVSMSTPFINLFNAIGKLKISLMFMVLWTALLWGLVIVLMRFFGYDGISIAFFVMSLTFIFVVKVAHRYVHFSLKKALYPSFISMCVMGVYLFFIREIMVSYFHTVLLHVVFSIIGAVVLYFLFIFLLKGKAFYQEMRELFVFKKDTL